MCGRSRRPCLVPTPRIRAMLTGVAFGRRQTMPCSPISCGYMRTGTRPRPSLEKTLTADLGIRLDAGGTGRRSCTAGPTGGAGSWPWEHPASCPPQLQASPVPPSSSIARGQFVPTHLEGSQGARGVAHPLAELRDRADPASGGPRRDSIPNERDTRGPPGRFATVTDLRLTPVPLEVECHGGLLTAPLVTSESLHEPGPAAGRNGSGCRMIPSTYGTDTELRGSRGAPSG